MRQFLAIPLPAELRKPVLELRERLMRRTTGWRWVRPEGLHLTLRFLGEVTERVDRAARERWRGAAARVDPSSLELTDVGTFPGRGRPRVLWVGLTEPVTPGILPVLAELVEDEARTLGFAPEDRPFRPHLTLARAARGGSPARPEGIVPQPTGSGTIDRLVLYRSRLDSGGARYTELDSFPLGARS